MADRRLVGLLIFFTVVAVGLSIGTSLLVRNVQSNDGKIARLQAHDAAQSRAVDAALTKANKEQDAALVNARRAEWRICVRQQVTRAAILLDERDEGHSVVFHLPLYDCAPNLTGGAARLLNASGRNAFLRHVSVATNLP
jgi:hypothetical protein